MDISIGFCGGSRPKRFCPTLGETFCALLRELFSNRNTTESMRSDVSEGEGGGRVACDINLHQTKCPAYPEGGGRALRFVMFRSDRFRRDK